MMPWWLGDGRRSASGSLLGSVSAFGAVAPTIMPSSRPTPDTVMATLGLASPLQASLRITVLMSRSIGPVGPRPSTGPYVPDWLACSADPAEPAAPLDTCLTSPTPPLTPAPLLSLPSSP